MKFLSKFFLGVLLLTVFSAATEAPIAAADFDLVVGIEVGESLTINDIDWFALVNSDSFDLSGPFLTEGDGSTCVLGGKYGGDVVGKASGTCIAKYIVEADGSPQSLFFRVDVGGGSDTTEAPATTTVAPTTVDVDLVAEILVGETFVTYLGFKNLGLVDSFSVYALKVNLIEGDASACVFGGGHGDDVVGKAPGTCLLEASLSFDPFDPSPNWEVVYFRINVTVPPPTIIATAKTFVPPVDFEWTEARDANKDYFDLVQAIETWNLGYTGEGSVVAIIDSGFEVTHPDFTDRIILEVCLSAEYLDDKCPNGEDLAEGPGALYPPTKFSGTHGTGVAGVVHQFAPDARFIFIEPVGGGPGSVGRIDLAYNWVLDNAERYGIDALVMSYGENVSQREALVTGEDCPDPEDENEKFAAMKALGVVPIAASGNDGFLESAGGTPGCYEDVASVGWANRYGLVDMASNVHESLALLAPAGLQVAAAEIEDMGSYAPFPGTSGAAPVVGALIAIARQINPGATADELIELARSTAYSVDDFLVKDIRLVDFLTFSQTLAGVTVSPKKDISLKPDGVVNLFVGESVDRNDLCLAGGFSLDCFEQHGVQKFIPRSLDRISGFASICEIPSASSGSLIVGASPGTCFFSVGMAPWSGGDDEPTEAEYQERLIQVNVETLDLSSVDSVLEIKVGELLDHDVFYITGVFPNNLFLGDPEFLRGEGSVCTLVGKQTYKGPRVYVFGKAPGTCVVKIKSQSEIPSVGYFAINVTE
tara:strand:+ start:42 stop:2330 length:2289 start_codon:yes stop_codon:yes gene_type:complete